jgi:hypothetical protein
LPAATSAGSGTERCRVDGDNREVARKITDFLIQFEPNTYFYFEGKYPDVFFAISFCVQRRRVVIFNQRGLKTSWDIRIVD